MAVGAAERSVEDKASAKGVEECYVDSLAQEEKLKIM